MTGGFDSKILIWNLKENLECNYGTPSAQGKLLFTGSNREAINRDQQPNGPFLLRTAYAQVRNRVKSIRMDIVHLD